MKKPASDVVRKAAAKKPDIVKKTAGAKKAASKKAASKKASINPKKTTASKKVTTSKTSSKKASTKAATKKVTSKNPVAKKAASSKAIVGKAEKAASGSPGGAASPTKSRSRTPESKNDIPAAPNARPDAAAKSVAPARQTVKRRPRDSELADSIHQGLAKQGQKKRGWRDIEALTERARLKSLLSDIWHEDIDLDSDIFGETDQFSSYYTDKEEEIEVEDDEDEEWEEFEEDES